MKVEARGRVKFWEHIWCRDVRLRDAYPWIICLTVNGDAEVADYLKMEGDAMWWDVMLHREVQD